MAIEFEFIGTEDKPALVAVSNPEYSSITQAVLLELGYKVHLAASHEDFETRYGQVQYQVVVIEEAFASPSISENVTLASLQWMPMARRRHSTVILMGPSFQTLHAMQAFQQSVHAVVNPEELTSLNQIIQKVTSDNNLFLNTYRDCQTRISKGK